MFCETVIYRVYCGVVAMANFTVYGNIDFPGVTQKRVIIQNTRKLHVHEHVYSNFTGSRVHENFKILD